MSTVLITGSAKRIGAAIAQRLSASGLRVVLHANHSEKEVARLCATLRERGAWAEYVLSDLSTSEGALSLFAQAMEKAGSIDVLVNNASVFSHTPFLKESPEGLEYQWRINTMAPMLLTQALARHLEERKADGAVVNLLDQRIIRPTTGALAYQVSKQALEAFTYSAAKELAPHVRINAVAPGAVLRPEFPSGKEPAGAFLTGRHPLPEEIAEAVLYLIRSSSVVGQTLFVDGGQHLS